jgi:hypothetical protein
MLIEIVYSYFFRLRPESDFRWLTGDSINIPPLPTVRQVTEVVCGAVTFVLSFFLISYFVIVYFVIPF